MKTKINCFENTINLRIEDDQSGIISYNGSILRLNDIAVELILKLDLYKSTSKVIESIATEYGVCLDLVSKDFNDLIKELGSIGISLSTDIVGELC